MIILTPQQTRKILSSVGNKQSETTREGETDGHWTCAKCTFINTDPAVTSCAMCVAPKKVVEPESFVEVSKKKRASTNDTVAAAKAKVEKERETALMNGFRKANDGYYACWILDKDIPDFIGPKGLHVRRLKNKTGVEFVGAEQFNGVEGWCPIMIKGNKADVRHALEIIESEAKARNRNQQQPHQNSSTNCKTTNKDSSGGSANGKISSTIWIDETKVSLLVGSNGSSVKRFTHDFGVVIFADNGEKTNEAGCPVYVSGPRENVEQACAEILRRFGKPKPESSNSPVIVSKNESVLKKTVWILNADVPRLIGEGGSRIQKMIQKYGVWAVSAFQKELTEDGFCPIEVKGLSTPVEVACDDIVERFCGRYTESPVGAVAVLPRDKKEKQMQTKQKTATPSLSMSQNLTAPSSGTTLQDRKTPTTTSCPPITPVSSQTGSGGSRIALVATGRDEPPQAKKEEVSSPVEMDPITASVEEAKSRNMDEQAIQGRPLIPTPIGTLGAGILPVSSLNQQTNDDADATLGGALLDFLIEHQDCLKVDPTTFAMWLSSMDITSMEELSEALEDKEFVSHEMNPNGLKGFKSLTLKKAAKDHACRMPFVELVAALGHEESSSEGKLTVDDEDDEDLPLVLAEPDTPASDLDPNALSFVVEEQVGVDDKPEVLVPPTMLVPRSPTFAEMITSPPGIAPPPPPSGVTSIDTLICPLTFQLMYFDPVTASDGITYERKGIEAWFSKLFLLRQPLTSPVTGNVMPNPFLTPNTLVRNMARARANKTPDLHIPAYF